MAPLRKTTPSSSSSASPGFGCPGSGGGPGSGGAPGLGPLRDRSRLGGPRAARAGRAAGRASPARRARPSPGPRGPGRRSPRARRRRAPGRAAAAPPRSRCCRRGCRGSPGAIRGWSGSTIVAARIASSAGDASTGKVLTLRARLDRRPGRALALERRDEAARRRSRPRRGWRAGWPSSASVRSSPGSTSVVLWTQARIRHRPGSSSGSQRSRARPRTVRVPSNANGSPTPSPSVSRERRPELEPPLDRPVALARGLQEADRRAHLGLGLGGEHAFEPQVVEGRRHALGVGGRVDDPERGRGRVLGRPGRVRVQRVALVEERGDQPLELLAHPQPSPSLASSSSTTASKVGRPRSTLRRCSAASVRLSTGTQAR